MSVIKPDVTIPVDPEIAADVLAGDEPAEPDDAAPAGEEPEQGET
jgi:hypothetical protein